MEATFNIGIRTTTKIAFLILSTLMGYFFAKHRAEKRVNRAALKAFNLTREPTGIVVGWYPNPKSNEISCLSNEAVIRHVSVENHSTKEFSSSSDPRPANPPVNIAYRLYEEGSEKHFFESDRSYLSEPVPPKDNDGLPRKAIVPIQIQCPDTNTPVTIRVEAVQENVAWQHDVASPGSYATAKISPVSLTNSESEDLRIDQIVLSFASTSRGKTWADVPSVIKAKLMAQSLLRVSQSEVFDSNQKITKVWTAGSIYPQVWVRDMATVQEALNRNGMKLSQHENFWPQLFLEHQADDGEIADWILPFDVKNITRKGKNTIQSDQELWLVWSVLRSIKMGYIDRQWLMGEVRNHSRGERLNMAIRWLLVHRYDSARNCVWSGHVADWGDVGLQGADESTSTKLRHSDLRSCGIFLQALFYWTLDLYEETFSTEALKDLLVNRPSLAENWRKVIKDYADTSLWSDELGAFLMHQHIQISDFNLDERKMFALGGNVLATESGLASETQSRRIAQTILSRKRQFQLPTVGFVLVPPFPPSTYENPIMDEEWEYQNGGDWDWYGFRAAKLIAKYDPQSGFNEFETICEKIVRQGTFYEWNGINGRGFGAANMRVGAATIWW